MHSRKQKNESGIAIILSVLILASLLMLTFMITDVVIRIGQNAKQISQSETAYFAAESAVEQAIYQIENLDATGLGTLAVPTTGNLTNTEGNWQRYVEAITTIVPTCFDDQNRISFPADPTSGSALNLSCVYAGDSNEHVDRGNPLQVRLKPGKSFEINFNLSVPDNAGPEPPGYDFYPNAIQISWPLADGNVIDLTSGIQTAYDTSIVSSVNRIPESGQMDTSPDSRVRIINTDASDVIYTLQPNTGSGIFNLGISVTVKGYYGVDEKERIIVITKRNWEIY